MLRDQEIDALLDQTYSNVEDAVSAIMTATMLVNEELAEARVEDDRIRKWIKRLIAKAREVVRDFEAEGFSISVGLPAGVSLTFDWSRED